MISCLPGLHLLKAKISSTVASSIVDVNPLIYLLQGTHRLLQAELQRISKFAFLEVVGIKIGELPRDS
jgi:hypothetical protein